MTNATGVMGTADEWLMVDVLDGPSSPARASEHLDAVVRYLGSQGFELLRAEREVVVPGES